jgi:hypothetical protein
MKKNLKFIMSIMLIFLVLFAFSALAEKESAGLIFSHKKHVIDNEISCETCHAAVENSQSGTDNLLPGMDVCGNCHDVESTDNCKMCHSNPDNIKPAVKVQNYFPLFSHKMHLSAGLDCASCHAEMRTKTTVEPYVLPVISNCQQCHSERKVMPRSHVPNYYHIHGDDARTNLNEVTASQNCVTCHSNRFCQNCHEGDNLDRKTHPLNYEFTHSLDARGKERDCVVCHTERSFCVECHQQNMIMPFNHVGGWAIPFAGGTHQFEAQNDLENCMSCHTGNAEQTCQKSGCHSK